MNLTIDRSTEFLDPDAVRVNIELMTPLVPVGLQGLVPQPPPGPDDMTWRPDLGRFFDKALGLPCIERGGDFAGWGLKTAARFRCSLDSVASIVDHCELLLQAGADPWGRRFDLDLAAWEVVLQWELSKDRDRHRSRGDVGKVIISTAGCSAWLQERASQSTSAFSRGWTVQEIEEECAGLKPNGVLGRLGYRVGASARDQMITPTRRQNALKDAFCIQLDMIGGANPQWWGMAGTQSRLDAIRRNINLFKRLAEARVLGDWQPAIDDWTADLEWMDSEWGSAASN